jgi:hypothetical protein
MTLLNCKAKRAHNGIFGRIYLILLEKVFDEIEPTGESTFNPEFTLRLLAGLSTKTHMWYKSTGEPMDEKLVNFVKKCTVTCPRYLNDSLITMIKSNFLTSSQIRKVSESLVSSMEEYQPSVILMYQLSRKNVPIKDLLPADRIQKTYEVSPSYLIMLMEICNSQINS